MMNGKLLVIMWDGDPACRTCALRDAGWFVLLESQDSGQAVRVAEVEAPDAVIIDLAVRPTHGWAVARALRAHPSTRTVPLILLGEPEPDAGADLPGMMVATWDRLEDALAQLKPALD